MAEWISVKERLPDKNKYDWVLVIGEFAEGGFCVPHIAELRNGIWFVDCYDEPFEELCAITITHWQPLPEQPRTPKERGADE